MFLVGIRRLLSTGPVCWVKEPPALRIDLSEGAWKAWTACAILCARMVFPRPVLVDRWVTC